MIIFSGGKTGGHIMPLVSLCKKAKEEVLYIGYSQMLEERICEDNAISFLGIKPKKGKLITIFSGFIFLCKKLKRFKITALVSSGGFVSTSAILYAFFHHIPIYLLELNLVMGNSNALFSRIAKKVFLAYPLPKMKKKYFVTGIPLRKQTLAVPTTIYDVLIIGGSLGSKVLCDLAQMIDKKYRVCLISGAYFQKQIYPKNVFEMNYAENIYSLMKSARVIISRSGASTTSEIFSLGVPLILVPSEQTSKNHQVLNAEFFASKKAAVLLREKEAKNINEAISSCLSDYSKIKVMTKAQHSLIYFNPEEKILSYIQGDVKNA